MSTEKTSRAWLTALVTTALGAVLAAAGGLVREILVDQDVSGLGDPDSILGSWVYAALAPLGSPGIVGDRPFDNAIVELLGGLAPFVVVVFLFTWLAARVSAVTTLLGTWLGTMLGAGLGGVASFEVFVRRNDLADSFFGVHQARVDRLEAGLYWGAVIGLLLGLLAMLVRRMTAKSATPAADDAAPWPPPPEPTSAFARPTEPDTADVVSSQPATDDTVTTPAAPSAPSAPSEPEQKP